jgi:hypothetical protein
LSIRRLLLLLLRPLDSTLDMAEEKIQTTDDGPSRSTTSVRSTDVEFVRGAIDEKRLLRKLDLRLLPAVSVLYLLSFLDRSNGMFCLQRPHLDCEAETV